MKGGRTVAVRALTDPEPDPIVVTLRAARIRLGWSQVELARRLNTKQSAISEIETGVTSPTLVTLRLMAAELGVVLMAGF